MARRAAGEGNIRKRADGRWEGRYVAGHDSEGKPIRKNVLGKTQAEAKEKLKAALEECQRLDVSRADDFTVESWMRLWYETYSKPNIREATQERYWNHIQYHIIPEIGSIKLNKLSGRQVQTMYNNVRDHGRVKKGPNDKRSSSLSASYIRSLHRMLHMALERAVKEQLILRNPCDDVILPREEKREMKTLKPENFKAYLEEAERRGVRPMMFPSPVTGGMYYPDAVNAINRKIMKALGLEPIRFHDLRHTFATTALQSGADIRTVSGMLGHADPGFTLRTYTHTSNPMQVKAAETIGSVMGKNL